MYTVNKTEKNGTVTATSFPRFAMAWSYAKSVGGVVDVPNGSEPDEAFEITDCNTIMAEKRRILLLTLRPETPTVDPVTTESSTPDPIEEEEEEEEVAPDTEREDMVPLVSDEASQAAE